MKRIVIIGATGAGKTTLANQLAQKLGIKAVDLDDLHWQPGWKPRPFNDFAAEVAHAAAEDSWVITGNYGKLHDLIWSRADAIVWLDYKFSLVLGRLLGRSWRRIREQNVVCNGNRESWGRLFSSGSVLWWLVKSYRKKRRMYGRAFANPKLFPSATLIHLCSPGETERFVQHVK